MFVFEIVAIGTSMPGIETNCYHLSGKLYNNIVKIYNY